MILSVLKGIETIGHKGEMRVSVNSRLEASSAMEQYEYERAREHNVTSKREAICRRDHPLENPASVRAVPHRTRELVTH